MPRFYADKCTYKSCGLVNTQRGAIAANLLILPPSADGVSWDTAGMAQQRDGCGGNQVQ